MKWFKRHPDFLRAESKSLSSDSNYSEIFQWRDNLFLSHGNIVARLDRVHKHPVLIVYPEATPYQLPRIYLLESELTENEVKQLASLSVGELSTHIAKKVKFYYHVRHQMRDGSLCILEWDNLDDGSKFYGITTVLKRVRDWFAGLFTGVFPPDNQAVEYTAHFKNIADQYYFFYSDQFLDPQFTHGLFYAVKASANVGKIGTYSACLIDGFTSTGLLKGEGKYFSHVNLNEKLKSTLDFQMEAALVGDYVSTGKLMYGVWFDIGETLMPFESFSDLITIIGNGTFESGVEEISKVVDYWFQKKLPDEVVVGLRYPNRLGAKEFQLFTVSVKKNPPPIIVGLKHLDRTNALLDCYGDVKAIVCEKFNAETFHLRNSTRATYDILKKQIVIMFGVGSLGSEVADGFAKGGFGKIHLFDNGIISPNNPVRHLAGIDWVGKRKSEAVQHILFYHNPFIHVEAHYRDLYEGDLLFELEDQSIIVSTVADDNLEGYINERAIIANKTMFYARALRGGKAARIFRVIPGKDACFQCLNLYRDEDSSFIKIPEDRSLPTLVNECNNPVRPGSAMDLKIIASLAARIITDQVQSGATSENHWVWSTEIIQETTITEPFKLYSQIIPPHKRCIYCNHDKKLTVSVSPSALATMRSLVGERPGIETGGVLAGEVDDDGNIIITHVSGPGPNAKHERTRFEKDIRFCQDMLDAVYVSSGGATIYVGEWHSHPDNNNAPSGLDIKSLSEIGLQKEYLTVNPVMIIFGQEGTPSCSIHPAGKLHYFADLHQLDQISFKQ